LRALQYNVTVTAWDASGRMTQSANRLQFTTPRTDFLRVPPPASPAATLTLLSAAPTSPTSGTATADPSPDGAFDKVRRRDERPAGPGF
jgi:hypothetical protein